MNNVPLYLAGEFVQKPISIFDSVEIAQAIKGLNVPQAKLDIGKLTYEYQLDDNKHNNRMCIHRIFKNT